MGATERIGDIEQLTAADAADGLNLSTEAGWNQTAADWHWLLTAGAGFGVRESTGRLIATSLALPYPPDFGWISMVLVHQPYRRRGLATKLLVQALDYLRANGLVAVLDATPAGRAVYTELGFIDVAPINRWRGTVTAIVEDTPVATDLAGVAQLDASAFGADRLGLLRAIAERPTSRVILGDQGYALIRHGRTAAQCGPIVAQSPAMSVRLFELALKNTAGATILDVPETASELSSSLHTTGFVIERKLTRMAHAQSQSFGNPALVAAIAGPELG